MPLCPGLGLYLSISRHRLINHASIAVIPRVRPVSVNKQAQANKPSVGVILRVRPISVNKQAQANKPSVGVIPRVRPISGNAFWTAYLIIIFNSFINL